MTSGRFALTGAALLAVTLTLAASGCEDGAPCTDCPAIEGTYTLAFQDGGVPGECAVLGVELPQGEALDITRSGERLTGTLEGVSFQGTVSAQGAFSLAGNQAGSADGGRTDIVNLTGVFTPPVEDGGTARLNGTYTGNFSRAGPSGPQRCNVVSPFSATRE